MNIFSINYLDIILFALIMFYSFFLLWSPLLDLFFIFDIFEVIINGIF